MFCKASVPIVQGIGTTRGRHPYDRIPDFAKSGLQCQCREYIFYEQGKGNRPSLTFLKGNPLYNDVLGDSSLKYGFKWTEKS